MTRVIIVAALAAALSFGLSDAAWAKKSSGSHSSSGHSSSARSGRHGKLPAGTRFVKKSCKTASCRAKHPGGTYMLPIKPKKKAA